MTLLGIGLLVLRISFPSENGWVENGLGTALLLVAASILFVAVFEMLGRIAGNVLSTAAIALTAVFGYVGTMVILEKENTLMLAIVFLATFYVGWAGLTFMWIARVGRFLFARPRSRR